MGLEEYTRKRDFARTPEPAGGHPEEDPGRSLEFVVQKHDASHLHYDFRLELGGVLKSWAVPKGPSTRPGTRRLAMETEDHPMEYGGFEGVIPKGQYGGGTVMLWDRGTWIPEGDPEEGYEEGRLRFRLEGQKLRGSWILTRMNPKPGEKKPSWLLIKSRDAGARASADPEVTDALPLSVTTGRDLAGIAAESDRVWDSRAGEQRPPGTTGAEEATGAAETASARAREQWVDPSRTHNAKKGRLKEPKPQLATLSSEAPEGEDWIHELKFDGYRVLCRVQNGRARLTTRNGKDWTDRFPEIAAALEALDCDSALLDGEVVVLDREGVSRFQRLQNALSGAGGARPLLYAFDLLHLDGWDVTGAGVEERKELLRPLVAGLEDDRIRYSDHVRGQGRAFHERACAMGVEGIISKRVGRPYRPGRGKSWLKVKCTARQEFVVVGFTDPGGSRVGIGALLLGVHDEAGGKLVYAGKVGTGFDARALVDLEGRLSKLEQAEAPVVDPPRGAAARGVHWVRPALVAEVAFTEWTDDGRIRHPSYQGLREDKKQEEVVREDARATAARDEGQGRVRKRGGGPGPGAGKRGTGRDIRVAGVRVSSPEKVLWPGQGVTKRELVSYYEAVSDAVLARLVDRPLTLVRCPSGAAGKCFFQKHANDSVPQVIPRVDIGEGDGGDPYMYVDGLPSLISLVQLGVLEFHIWGSRRDRLDRPDRLVFDLDPDEGLPFGRVAAAAFRLRDLLGALGLESFPKSTGGKGLHLVVPITRRTSFDEAKEFAHAVARRMTTDDPAGFTANMSKKKRKDRIFVDYLRNAWNATAIADYSTRARPGAPVAVPLRWDEVSTRARQPPSHTIRDVPDRIAADPDPWEGFDEVRQSITAAARRELGLA
jgi:bifunctional non-homologous end joining protein LigD